MCTKGFHSRLHLQSRKADSRPGDFHFPIITTLIGTLALANVASAVLMMME